MAVIHCRDFVRYPAVTQIISEPYWCCSWLQLSVHCWLGWTCVSHQPHVPSSDSDTNVLPNARLHCTWTNWEGQNKDCIWDLLPVFAVKLRLSLFTNSFCARQFTGVGFGQPWFTGVGFAILQEGLFSSSVLMFGNRGLFPAETLANGECFQYGPSVEWQSHCDLLAPSRRWELAEAAAVARQANTLVDSLHYSLAHIVLPPKYNSAYTCITLR